MPFLSAIISGIAGALGTVFGTLFSVFGGLLKNFLMRALQGGGGKGAKPSRTQSVREAVSSREIIYGRANKSGSLILMENKDGDKSVVHMVVAIAGHECDSYERFFLNGQPLKLNTDNTVLQDGFGIGDVSSDGLTFTLAIPNSRFAANLDAGDRITFGGREPSSNGDIAPVDRGDVERLISTVNTDTGVIELTEAMPDKFKGLPNYIWKWEDYVGTTQSNNTPDDGYVVVAGEQYAPTLIDGQWIIQNVPSDVTSTRDYTVREELRDGLTQYYIEYPTNYSRLYLQNAGGTLGGEYREGSLISPGEYGKYAKFTWGLGADDQAVNTTISSEIAKWTSSHRLRGIAYVALRMEFNQEAWPNGLPTPHVTVKGKKVYDPRTGLTAWSDNPALCIYDYMIDTKYGLGVASGDINTQSVIDAANVCDEQVDLLDGNTESRYTCNGVLDTADEVGDNLNTLLGSMKGMLVKDGAEYYMYAGAWRTPTVLLDEADVVGEFTVASGTPYRERFNGVKGTFYSELNDWELSDFPNYQSSALATRDEGVDRWKDVQLPMTDSPSTAQRIAKIDLLENRSEDGETVVVTGEFGLNAWGVKAGDFILLSNADMGWSGKSFRVDEWSIINLSQDEQQGPNVAIKMVLHSISSTAYDWDESTEETEYNQPVPSAPSHKDYALPPLNFAATSGDDTLQVLPDGTVLNKVQLTWDPISNTMITSGGHIEIGYKPSTSSAWQEIGNIAPSAYQYDVPNLTPGVAYDFYIRTRDSLKRIASPRNLISQHTVAGKDLPPGNVARLQYYINGRTVTLTWDKVTDTDLAGYRIKRGPNWTDGQVIASLHMQESWTHVFAPGRHKLLVKAVDTSGNESTNVAVVDVVVANQFTTNTEWHHTDQHLWPGTTENFVEHHTGVLIPQCSTTGSLKFSEATFKEEATWTLPEVDLGSNLALWVYGSVNTGLLPGGSGSPNPRIEIKYRLDGEGAGAAGDVINLIDERGTLTGMYLHHSGALVPSETELGSARGPGSAYGTPAGNATYTSPEIDLGDDMVVEIVVETDSALYPGESGAANVGIQIDYRTAGGSYTGFTESSGGEIEARYVKVKLTTDTDTGVTVIKSATLTSDNWAPWYVPGEITARYVQLRVRVVTSEAPAKITGYDFEVRTQ